MATYNPTRPTGMSIGLGGTTKPTRDPSQPVDPYAGLPPVQPMDNSWYQQALDQMNQQARQSAQQARAYSQQQTQQAADFAAQYMQMRQQMAPTPRPRQSRMYVLGGY